MSVPKEVVARRASDLLVKLYLAMDEKDKVEMIRKQYHLEKLTLAFAILEENGQDIMPWLEGVKALIKKYDIKEEAKK